MVFRHILGLGAVVAIGALVLSARPVRAQFEGVTFETLAIGQTDVSKVEKIEKGPTTILVQAVTVDPGAGPPWHCHPGPTLFVVTQGTWNHYHPDGTVETLVGGSDFSAVVEPAGEVRRGENIGDDVLSAYIIFLDPVGTPTIPVDGPDAKCPH